MTIDLFTQAEEQVVSELSRSFRFLSFAAGI